MAAVSQLTSHLSWLDVTRRTSLRSEKKFPENLFSLSDQMTTLFHLIPKEPFHKKDAGQYHEMIAIHLEALQKTASKVNRCQSYPLIELSLKKRSTSVSHMIDALNLEPPIVGSFDSKDYYRALARHEQKVLMIKMLEKVDHLTAGIKSYVLSPLELIEEKKHNPICKDFFILPRKTRFFTKERMLNTQYNPRLLLGSGSFGQVWVIGSQTHSFAYKKPTTERDAAQSLKDEALIYMQLSHQNIVRLEALTNAVKEDETHLILEFVRGTPLIDQLYKSFPPEEELSIFIQIAEALSYIHAKGFIHRDIKLDNVLYDLRTKKCKVFDFNLSIPQGCVKKAAGTYYYMAPELLDPSYHDRRSEKVDVWAFGVLMYHFLSKGLVPFPKLNSSESTPAFFKRMSHKLDKPSRYEDLYERKDISETRMNTLLKNRSFLFLSDLIQKCLHGTPEERPSMEQVVTTLKSIDLSDSPPGCSIA